MNHPHDVNSEEARWRDSRAGARAGRGFRYQDAVAALLVVQQWRGETPHFPVSVVPEGLDDVVIRTKVGELRLQVKSKHDPQKTFPIGEIADYFVKAAAGLSQEEWLQRDVSIGLVLERDVDGVRPTGWQATLDEGCEASLREALLQRIVSGKSPFSVDDVLCRAHLIVESAD